MPTKNSESYGEFKGSTSTKLEMLFIEIKELREDINGVKKDIISLKGFKSWVLGFGFAAGFFAGFVKDLFFRR